MASPGASHHYQSLLGADSFRILLVQPAGVWGAELECSLIHTTLSECDYDLIDPYTALSYVWGDPNRTGTVRIDAQVVTITATLEAALRDLRDGARARRVWADAVCIDQLNVTERNHQVALMGRIYSTAQHTVIHLGNLTAEANGVLSAASQRPGNAGNRLLPVNGPSVTELAQQDLLNRSWFRRIWIFQELVLSKDPWVQCGDVRVRWADFCKLLVPSRTGNPPGNLQMLADMNMHRQSATVGSMFGLLTSRRGLGATDPRDFVYAHLGIASDLGRVSQYLQVDYRKPVEDTFSRAARYIIDTKGVTTAFSHMDDIQPSELREGLPSWAPDWSRSSSLAATMYADNMLSRLKLAGKFYAFTEEPMPPVLAHVGYKVDVIEEVSAILPPSHNIGVQLADDQRAAISDLRALYQSVGGTYTSGDRFGRYTRISLSRKQREHEVLCEALYRTWLASLRYLCPSRPEDARAHAKVVDSLETWLGEEARQLRIFVGQDAEGMIRLAFLYFLAGTAQAVFDGRRLAQTESGRFAVVPANAVKGDIVTYLAGSDIAVLVRKRHSAVDAKLEQAIEDTVVGAHLWLTASGEEGLSWQASPTTPIDIMHCFALGQCYVDGLVGWGLREPPSLAALEIFAMH
jgi:hypothetical protein